MIVASRIVSSPSLLPTFQTTAVTLTDDIIDCTSTDTISVTSARLDNAFYVTGALFEQFPIRNTLCEILIGVRLKRTSAQTTLAQCSFPYAVVGQPAEVSNS